MDPPQLERVSLPTAVKPVWVPPIGHFSVYVNKIALSITRSVNGAQMTIALDHWERSPVMDDNEKFLRNLSCIITIFGCAESTMRPKWMPRNSFRYEAENSNPWASRLGRQSIRLFALELDDKDTITGTLIPFDRSETPQYSALPHVCGQGSCDQEIYVNGGSLCVKPNLLAALKQLKSCLIRRLRGNEDSSVPLRHTFCWIWVDAMCINQEDATEKAE